MIETGEIAVPHTHNISHHCPARFSP
jgi:hypothetical protein